MSCKPKKEDPQEIFIALLGSTGNGKTSTINAFVQIVSYLSLALALESKEPIILVPLQYKEFYEDGSEEVISYMGYRMFDAANEQRQNSSRSCTQSPRMYRFTCGDKIFNFIDMPGFGDTDGDGEDELHRKRRYAFLERIPQIHAIVAVIKANDNNLPPPLVASLNDILSMVPTKAASNLMFFANYAWLTNFQAGLMGASLESFLADANKKYGVNLTFKNNVYFVDYFGLKHFLSHSKSEKYRRLSSNINLGKAETCWQKTTEALHAMTRKALTLPGIPSTDIASINFARTVIEIVVSNLIKAMEKANNLRSEFQNPSIRATQIRRMRQAYPKETSRKSDEQVINLIIQDYRNSVKNDVKLALKALSVPAGFLKHHCIAPLSNGNSTRLKNQITAFKSNAEYDAAEVLETELNSRNEQYQTIEAILMNATTVRTFNETLITSGALFDPKILKVIGKDNLKALEEYQKSAKFEFEDTVVFKAKYFIQDLIDKAV